MGAELPPTKPLPPKRIDADPQLELELAVSAEYRIFHSEFLARSQDDRDKAICWYRRQLETCRGCGTRPEEWDPKKGGKRGAYLPQILQCDGCVVKQRTEDAPLLKEGRGYYVVLIRNLFGRGGG